MFVTILKGPASISDASLDAWAARKGTITFVFTPVTLCTRVVDTLKRGKRTRLESASLSEG